MNVFTAEDLHMASASAYQAGPAAVQEVVAEVVKNEAGQVSVVFAGGKSIIDHVGAKFYAAPVAAAPEGFVMVPVDLRTRAGYEMWEAGIRVRNTGGSVEEMWAAMLAARPQGVK